MAATVHHLHPLSRPLAGFLRVGHTGQRKLETLLAAGRFPYRRVVFDAARLALLQQLEPAVRSARLGAKLKIADDDTRRLVDDARKRLVALRDALDDLESRGGMATRSPAVAFRGGGGAVSAVLGR